MREPVAAGSGWAGHLTDDVLAWWTANGPDLEHGGVLTCWDNAGTTLLSTDKYTWSQGRWAWLTAQLSGAGRTGLLDVDAERYAALATSAAEFVRDNALLPDGTTAFVTDRQGRPHEPASGAGLHTSVFADLFAALGFAGAAQLGNNGWADRAERLLASADDRIRTGTAKSEPYPVPDGHRSFALPMILVGVAEQIYRATASERSLQVLRNAARQIRTHFLRGADVVEMPATRDRRDNTLLARHRTPGHALECLWFLHHAADLLTEGEWDAEWAADAAEHALEIGWDHDDGGLFRYADRDGGRPGGHRTVDRYESLVVDTWDTKLWWVHAETLYATRLLAESTGRASLAGWHERVRDYTMATFPQGHGREWTQTLRRDGTPLDATVALPVKDPFHVARSLLLLVRLDSPASASAVSASQTGGHSWPR